MCRGLIYQTHNIKNCLLRDDYIAIANDQRECGDLIQ